MYNFIRIQYLLGKITIRQVMSYAPKWITEEQAKQIIMEKERNRNEN